MNNDTTPHLHHNLLALHMILGSRTIATCPEILNVININILETAKNKSRVKNKDWMILLLMNQIELRRLIIF